jgi:hypothetical protein
MNPFSTLLPLAVRAAIPTRGRAVPVDPQGEPDERPAYPRLARLALGTKEQPREPDAPGRHERRASASKRVRPPRLSLAERAFGARFRARVAFTKCAAREATRAPLAERTEVLP